MTRLSPSWTAGSAPSRAHLAISGVVEPGVRREDQQAAGVAAPRDLLLAHDRLHDGVKAALRSVQVARDLGVAHLPLRAPGGRSVAATGRRWASIGESEVEGQAQEG